MISSYHLTVSHVNVTTSEKPKRKERTMTIKSVKTFDTSQEASEFINALPADTKITLGVEQLPAESSIIWKITAEIHPRTEAEIMSAILLNIATTSVEEKDAISYALSAIKTLQDMGVIK